MYPWLIPHWQQFTQGAAQGRLAHGWLLCGASGSGKGELAQAFARRVLCQAPSQAAPCGHCHACTLLARGHHPDLHLAEVAGRSIGVDTIRELIGQLAVSPQLGQAKVAILPQAQRMTESAANALLKTLEEPPGAAYLFLLTDQPNALLPTIVSRCRRLSLQPDEQTALAWLRQQADGQQATAMHLRLNQGAPLATLAYLSAGTEAQRQHLCQLVLALRQTPWRQGELQKLLLELPLGLGWLQLLLLDALKRQQGLALTDLVMQDCGPLLDWLAAKPSAQLLGLLRRLARLQEERQNPLFNVSLSLLDWLNDLIFEENKTC
ncbi:DNA polymerase III subunit delta' [Pseudaeromonas sp. ZJS20]|uniref:DNA polymerase III subunit delta' n=1 Tax=Pseudaeromonas aegiceratis TaxID=3153928 RepID=UPI00390C4645